MGFDRASLLLWLLIPPALAKPMNVAGQAQTPATSSSASPGQARKPAPPSAVGIDPGSLSNGVYRNKTLGFTCKIPEGWVLRTDEMNAPDENSAQPPAAGKTSNESQPPATPKNPQAPPTRAQSARVLLAAFSRPPQVRGQEVNTSIVIAAEPVATYPGLTDALQYLGLLTEVARAQGFTMDEDPYEIAIGTKKLVRGDSHKDVGTRVMRQSTLAMLQHGYAVSFTVIAGTDDDVEELIDGLDFATGRAVNWPRIFTDEPGPGRGGVGGWGLSTFRKESLQRFGMQAQVLVPASLFLRVLLHPGFPAPARGRVASSESQGTDIGVGNRYLFIRIPGIEPDHGILQRRG